MANFLSDPYRNSLLGKTTDYSARVDLDTDTIKCGFQDEGTATPAAANVFITSFSSGLVPAFASCVTLASPTIGVVGAGVFDAADTTFTALTGASVEGIVVFKNVTVVGDSPFLWYYNTGITGIPFTPSGGDVTIQWNASGLISV
jgi:hypothetical protein